MSADAMLAVLSFVVEVMVALAVLRTLTACGGLLRVAVTVCSALCALFVGCRWRAFCLDGRPVCILGRNTKAQHSS